MATLQYVYNPTPVDFTNVVSINLVSLGNLSSGFISQEVQLTITTTTGSATVSQPLTGDFQTLTWNLADFGFSPLQLQNVSEITFAVIFTTGEGEGSLTGQNFGKANAENPAIFSIDLLPCVGENTIVLTNQGSVIIKDIKTNDFVLSSNGQSHQVLFNIKFGLANEFILIKKGSLGVNRPDQDLYIRKGHPLWVRNREVYCQDLVNGKNIVKVKLEKPMMIYSICTQKRVFVMMNNVPVCTWSEKGWKEYCDENPQLLWSKQ